MPSDFDVRATGLSDKTIKQIYDVLVRFPSLEKAVVYGSRAKGNYEEGSDIDLTLWGDKSLHDDLWEITSALNHGGIGYEFDVSIFDELDHAKLRDHINKHGKLFYERKKALGWETVKLGEVCEVNLGKTPARKEKSYWDTEKKTSNIWVSIADMTALKGNVIDNSKEYISDKGVALIKSVTSGTLLLSFKLTIGRVAFAGKELRTNEAIAALPIKKEYSTDIIPEYLFHYLKGHDWDKEAGYDLKQLGKTLNKAKLVKIQIPLPPMEVQKEIVAKLDNIFAQAERGLESARRNAENADALFQSYLRDVFESRDKDWEVAKLGDTFQTVTGTTPPKKDKKLYGSFMPFVKPPELIGGIVDNAPDNLSSNGASVARVAPTGTVLIACIGNLGKVGLVNKPVAFNQQINAIFPDKKLALPHFLFFLSKSPLFRDQLERLAKGTTVTIVNKTAFNTIKIPLPPIKTQHTIVTKLDNIAAETQKLKEKYSQQAAAFEALKASVLRQAFAGKLTREIAA